MLLGSLAGILSLLVFWLPFWGHTEQFWTIDFGGHGMETIVQNFDGLNFLVIAKSLYDPTQIDAINQLFPTGNTPGYFAAHFPLFALMIRGFEAVLPAPYALLLAIILCNALLGAGLFAFFATFITHPTRALALTLLCLFFPARMLSTRAVGSNEPLFIALVLGSLTLSRRGTHWWAALTGALAVLTRSPGILLFGAYALAFLAAREPLVTKLRRFAPYLMMPLALMILFGFYGLRYGDFWAYFHSGDNLHLFALPFTIFSNMASWVSGMWREDIVYLYVFYGAGLIMYLKSALLRPTRTYAELAPALFALLYGLTLIFVSHRDLARYALPLGPLVYLGYSPYVRRAWLPWALVLLIPIYLLGWQFVVANVQPINNWQALL